MIPTKFHRAGLDWIPHTPGDPMPCPGDTRVRVLLSCEKENGTYDAGGDSARIWNWADVGHRSIVGWHPDEEQPPYVEEQPDPSETHRRAIEWHQLTDDGLRLRLGEVTAQEIRTVRAVLDAILGENTN